MCAHNDSNNETLEGLLKRYLEEATYSFGDFKAIKVDSVGRELETPLHMAVRRGASNDVKLLLRGGSNVNASTNIGVTPLHCAALNGDAGITLLLVEAGASICVKTSFGETAEMLARSSGYLELANILRRKLSG